MRLNFKSALLIGISILLILSFSIPVFAEADTSSSVEIRLKAGSNIISINGNSVIAAKPLKAGDILYVPLRTILEAFGAEVNWIGNGKINIIFRNVSVDMTVGERKCTVNQLEKELQASPITINKTTMVPLQFITDYFNISTSYDKQTDFYSIILQDDGALTDLSFLVGSISKPKVGNSYFRWSINIPKGSRISFISFSSKYTFIENDQRAISIEVSVNTERDKDLKEYYNLVNENPESYLNGELIDSTIDSGSAGYAEFLYINSYDEAVCQRAFINEGNLYNVILTSYNESDPLKIKKNEYYESIMDSFRLDYTGITSNIQDLTKVKFGLANYENYITSDTEKKYLSWDLSVLPEWDIISSDEYNPYNTKIGLDKKEYISVEIKDAEGVGNIEEYGMDAAKFYAGNFNAECYTLIDRQTGTLNGKQYYKLIFDIDIGKVKYIVDESFILVGNLIYDITLKSPEDKYDSQKSNYYKMLDTFKISERDILSIETDIEKYYYNQQRSRIGKDDKLVEYKDKTYQWCIKLPGFWIKVNSTEESFQPFSSSNSGALISVEVIDNKYTDSSTSDSDRFKYMNASIENSNAVLIGKNAINGKGYNVRTYLYRIEDADEEIFTDMKFYIIDAVKYSYCYMSIIPDICASEKNLNELQAAWDSFIPSMQ